MKSTVLGLYRDVTQAQAAITELADRGFGRGHVQLISPDQLQGKGENTLRDSGGDPAGSGTEVNLVFGSMFGGWYGGSTSDQDYHGNIFADAVRQGAYLLAVQSLNDQQHAEIINVLDRYEPIDIDDAAADWASGGGLSGRERDGYGLDRDTVKADNKGDNNAIAGAPAADGLSDSGTHRSFNGSRHGRLHSFTHRDDNLDSNRSAGAAMAATEGAGSNKEPNIYHDNTDDESYRSHWQSTYGHTGGRYEDHAPAYRYGSSLAGNEQYRGRRWEDFEPDARTDWESRHASSSGSSWEQSRDAVRHGWEKGSR